MTAQWETPFECIDPSIGGRIWRLADPELDFRLRTEIEAHLAACHACRVLRHLEVEAREMARAGEFARELPHLHQPQELPSRLPGRRRTLTRVFSISAAVLAGCVVAALLLPPRPVTRETQTRGTDVVHFLRPVEGEILSSPRPDFRWTPVAGASRYVLEIRDGNGRQVWRGESSAPTIHAPEDVRLVRGLYKAILAVTPADLIPPGRVSVQFRIGSAASAVGHRLLRTHLLLQAGLVATLVSMITSVTAFTLLRRRG